MAGGADSLAGLVREWLLLLLRFAITREPQDQVAVLDMAKRIDCLGRERGRPTPTFFRRSSSQICAAVTAIGNPEREAILRLHFARIEDQRLRSAIQAAARSGETPARDYGTRRFEARLKCRKRHPVSGRNAS